MKLMPLLPLALLAAPLLHAAPVAIPSADSVNFGNGTVAIRMTGESGVQYYIRTTSDLGAGNWTLTTTNPFTGTGSAADITVPIGNATRQLFRAESRFEERARLFIANYQRQLANGGPTVLSVNGASVQSTITITEDRANGQLVVTGNGVPNYTPTIMGMNVTDGWNTPVSGGFQSLKLSENNQGATGGNNPNRLVVATETFRIPLNPVYNATPTDTSLGTVGVAVNGIPIYNPFEDANQTAATGRIFSSCCGHPQLNGVYHYHKYPTCLRLLKGDIWQSEKEKCDEIDALIASGGHSPLIGFAMDGWPVYGPVGWRDSSRQSKLLKSSHTGSNDSYGNPTYISGSGDLDECNGINSPTPEFPEGIYHYAMSLEANANGTVVREISPYFGYDVRNTLKKHSLMPTGWETDTTYVNALKAGFTVNGTAIAGTNSFSTFYDFIVAMRTALTAAGMSAVAAEFETMKISYPFTIRKFRGTPSNGAGGGGGGMTSGGVVSISPASGTAGQSYLMTITLQALAGTPGLPPTGAPIIAASVGGIALTNPTRASTTPVTGTLVIPAGSSSGAKDVLVSFQGPQGQPAPSYTGTGMFQVTASNATVYSDSAANYTLWSNGSNGGTGFGAWSLSSNGSAGFFLANTANHSNMSVGASTGFGLWSNSGGNSTASRNFSNAMGAGDSFTIRFDNNLVDTSAEAGFALTDSAGAVRFRFYFVGGEQNYRITDATTGRLTSIPWTNSGLQISITQTASTTYSATIGATVLTGTLGTGSAISRLLVENKNAGAGSDHDQYIGEMIFSDAP